MIEIWFNILSEAALAGESFTAVSQVRTAIDACITVYNPEGIHSKGPKKLSIRDGCGNVTLITQLGASLPIRLVPRPTDGADSM